MRINTLNLFLKLFNLVHNLLHVVLSFLSAFRQRLRRGLRGEQIQVFYPKCLLAAGNLRFLVLDLGKLIRLLDFTKASCKEVHATTTSVLD